MRAALVFVAMLVVLVVLPTTAGAQASVDDQALLDRFAPVVAIRHQAKPCGDGERFRPVSVENVLGRDDVVLRNADDEIVARAPTAADLAGLGADHWLDLPGDALSPGCSYEKWFRSMDATPAIYGRVTGEQGRLVLQYWFYWVYNQWNDLHESDWEMVQLLFDTDDPSSAMTTMPSLYGYAQHEGLETGERGDDKVEIVDGTHPVVFPGEGSHSSYFSSSRWFGKSSATGFGCDDTTGPIDRLRPEVIVLPEDAPESGEFAWLSYLGHWGQREAIFDDGPTGPASKGDKWSAPVTWVADEGRDSSVALPFAQSGATAAFCDLSAAGSSLLNRLLDDPLRVALLIVAALIGIAVVVRGSSRGLLTRAARTWRRHARALLAIGGVIAAGGVAVWIVELAVVAATPMGTLVDVLGSDSAAILPLAVVTGAAILLPIAAWGMGATMRAVADGVDDHRARAVVWTPRLAVMVCAGLVVAILGLSLLALAPLVFLGGFWLLAPAASDHETLPVRAALGRSARLSEGPRWRALGLFVTMCLVLLASGVLGALVLLVTSVGFTGATAIVALANAVIVPYLALVMNAFYEELAAIDHVNDEEVTR